MTSCAPSIGGEKCQAGDPMCGNGAARKEKVSAAFHVPFEHPANPDDEAEINEQDEIIDSAELDLRFDDLD